MPAMMYKCFKCNKDVATSDIRYIGSADKTNIICISCLERYKMMKKGVKPDTDEFAEKSVIKQEKSIPKIQYMCQNCNYIFYIRKDSAQKHICPYCSKDKLVIKQQTM